MSSVFLKCNKCGEKVELTHKLNIIKKKIYCRNCFIKHGKELMEMTKVVEKTCLNCRFERPQASYCLNCRRYPKLKDNWEEQKGDG